MMSTTDITNEQTLQRLNDMPASQKEGLEKLLSLAEELHRGVDDVRRRIESIRFLQVTGALITFLGILFTIWYEGLPRRENVVNDVLFITTAALLHFFYYAVVVEYMIRRARRLSAPNSAALTEVVQLLREVEPALTKAENWSYLDRVQFRIRLSRFGVGSST